MAANPKASEAMESTTEVGVFGQVLARYFDELYLVFRLVFSFLVALHGAQKAFLLWGFPAAHPLGALVDIAGWVGFICAFLIGIGIFTRLGAGALCVTMVVAYFRVHANNGIWPHIFPPGGYGENGGEVAILWFIIAGIIGVLGSRKYGIERLVFRKEIF